MPYKYKVSAIYTITNLINDKIYVGYSKDYHGRKYTHFNMLRKGYHHCIHLQNAYNEYGENNFKAEILEEYPEGLLIAMEHYWATILNTHDSRYGYNDRETNPYNEYVWTKERRLKLSNSLKNSDKLKKSTKENGLKRRGRKMLKEQTERQFEARKQNAKERGYYHSQETIEKISKSNVGRIISQETKDKQRKSRVELIAKRPDLLENLRQSKKSNFIICLFKDGRKEEFKNLIDMSDTLKIPLTSIRSVSKGRYKNYKNELTIIKKSIYDERKDYSHLFKN